VLTVHTRYRTERQDDLYHVYRIERRKADGSEEVMWWA
jgi:hypothetical protein